MLVHQRVWSVHSEEPWGQLHPIAVSLSSRLLLQRPSRAHTFKLSRSCKAKWTMPMFPNALMFTNLWQLDTAWYSLIQLDTAWYSLIQLVSKGEASACSWKLLWSWPSDWPKSWKNLPPWLQLATKTEAYDCSPSDGKPLQWVHAQYALLHCFSFSIPLCIDPYLAWHFGWHLQ